MDTDEILQLIEDCEKRSEKLSEWEAEFIDSISRQSSLSQKQVDILKKIWEKVTSR